jgi:hypothetical protein
MEGGAGYTFEQVANMTQDQIFGRLCKINVLKRGVGKRTEVAGMGVSNYKKEGDGYVGRTDDGERVVLPIKEKSLAQRLMEEKQRNSIIDERNRKEREARLEKRRLRRERRAQRKARRNQNDGNGTS